MTAGKGRCMHLWGASWLQASKQDLDQELSDSFILCLPIRPLICSIIPARRIFHTGKSYLGVLFPQETSIRYVLCRFTEASSAD